MKFVKLASVFLVLLITSSGCEDDPDILLNMVPVSDAGASKSITLPVNTTTLTGTGTDSDGDIVAYLWSQVSGPDATIIVNPGSTSTAISGFVTGTYVFQLMVTDEDGATGVDTVSVVVNPSVQQTLTAQPANNPNERMIVSVGGADQSWTGSTELVIDAWSVSGQPYIGRSALKFDLSSIPATATILSANLFLYSNTPPQNGNLVDANFGTNNALVLRRITSNWTPSTATWTNQPSVTSESEILIPSTTLSALDLNLNVTSLVATMVNTNTNYGFLLKLQNEVSLNSRMFVSSYHTTKADKRPKLVINYSL